MKELFLTVKAMRSAQRHYFAESDRIRKQEYLESSKRLERQVDKKDMFG